MPSLVNKLAKHLKAKNFSECDSQRTTVLQNNLNFKGNYFKFITAFFALAIILFCLAVHWPWPIARSTEANPTRKSSLILFSQNNNDFESLLDSAKPASVKIDRSKQQLNFGKSILCCLRFPKIIEMEEVLKFLKSKQSPRSH